MAIKDIQIFFQNLLFGKDFNFGKSKGKIINKNFKANYFI